MKKNRGEPTRTTHGKIKFEAIAKSKINIKQKKKQKLAVEKEQDKTRFVRDLVLLKPP